MDVVTILGTRPEMIRLSLVIRKLDIDSAKHILVHTGQNYTSTLSDIFFEQMGIRQPDYRIHTASHSPGRQIGQIFSEVEQIIDKEKPDRMLVLGDTNSALCALLGERKGVPVFHMEAGNRCFDTRVPEEINRKAIDAVSSVNLPYTSISRDNLLREGMAPHRIWVTGNPIYEVMRHHESEIGQSDVLDRLGLAEGQYIVVTFHRAENVDDESNLKHIVGALHLVAEQWSLPLICSVHPRTRSRLQQYGIAIQNPFIQFHEPFGFFDFIALQKNACCVITDSGTVQEESCLLRVPAVTIRHSTERPETITCGSNVVSGIDSQRIAACVTLMMQSDRTWSFPEGYTEPNVSGRVVNMIVGGVSHV
ncbi:non-hydrolyzing UDP-N-acetylglucosamine 2-epimerase [Cohnella suwonensis]|uniref:Non-hydrolyzing UDP-N-acetylglucosamine 2-epimerase n=1 Tax=Cohnella suwonensis TaxID=696072 RepID=A0ABW0LSF8_9BACL